MATAQPLKAPVGAERRSPLAVALTALGWTVLILFAALEIFPFVFTVANSFKCLPAVQSYPRSLLPTPPFGVECTYQEGEQAGASRSANATSGTLTFNPTLEGYKEIFDENLPRWLVNTAFFAVAVTILRLGFDSLAGYALARLKFPGNRLLFFTILGTMMVPPIVLLIPRFIILKQLSMLNTYQGLIVPLAVDAFGIFLMKQFFEAIPGEIEEAALVDGANRFVLFWRVVLPMATSALTALAIFSFQGTWNDFLMPLIILSGNQDLWTLPLGLSFLRGAYGETLRWHAFLAGSVITTLPLALIFFYFQRYFVEGISYSGLKG
ncbi:MAG: carbohydrate ABC transporter permease [Anaerolineae bacterium]|nr:carbohydrate ABC transporter permease [Anaerolineae bacterium]